MATPVFAVDINDTRLVNQPAVSANAIAFTYANDIWTANVDGTNVRHLTTHPGIESTPRFSPDGSMIAFTGQYEGNFDVYVVPTVGGVPTRLTWHPSTDTVYGFTPDGKSVLFSSGRESFTNRYQQLYTIPVTGGAVTKLPIPNASKASYSPDGKTIAYVPLNEPTKQWKHYRGGSAARIMLFDTTTYAVEQIPQPKSFSNDTDPSWAGGKLYFRSDRDGEYNLYSYDRGMKQVTKVTNYSDFPVSYVSSGANRIAFEQGGYIHLFDPAAARDQRVKVGIADDLSDSRPRFVKGARFVRSGSLSPSGARAVVEFRGDIVTVPAEKGDDRDITNSPGVHDRSPVWSPDGKSIAWFSDEGGEYALRIQPQEGRGTVRTIKLEGAGFYYDPRWSPDSSKISYIDNARALYVVDVPSGAITKVSQNPYYAPGDPDLDHNWSGDSKWLAYTKNSQTYFHTVYLYSVDQKKSFQVTDGLSDARYPVFDPNGKYLYFASSVNAGPVQDWFALSNRDAREMSSIYLAVLPKGVVSPLAKESDEEAAKKEDAAAATAAKNADKKPAEEKKPDADKPAAVVVDFDGLSQRIIALPVPPAMIGYSIQVPKTGEILYTKTTNSQSDDPDYELYRFDLTKRKEDAILSDRVDAFEVSRDGKRVLIHSHDNWAIPDYGDKLDMSKRKLAVDAISVKIDPAAERKQMFDEAWRIQRDFFYDPNMHGLNWQAVHDKYAAMLPDVAVREDLYRLMQSVASELGVGHSYFFPAQPLDELPTVKGGLLGADYKVENGRYRFAKVFGGLNWNPDLRAPLTEPGVDVKTGEYLLAVDGKDLKYPDNLYARFERTAGRIVEITVGPNADGSGSRTVKVVPIENEFALRNRDWVEGNLRRVTEASNGRLAYVYLPNTSNSGYDSFRRYFFPQANREGVIVDERFNGGGSYPDYYIDILQRPYIASWAMRYGGDMKTPLASIQGPRVMLIDETAGSGGDLLPWMFRKLKMGTLVGRRTWGALVGILGFPDLMDGSSITAPNFGIWTPDEGWVVENAGVAPDVEVGQTPADVIAGKDPQLERAIQIAMQQLAANPSKPMTRPAYKSIVAK